MQRIDELQELLENFDELRIELTSQVAAFKASIQPSLDEQLTRLAGGTPTSSSSNGLTERTPLRNGQLHIDKEKGKYSAVDLDKWHTEILSTVLHDCSDASAKFASWKSNETVHRKTADNMLKSLYDQAEEQFQAKNDAHKELARTAINTANQLLNGVKQSVETIFPAMQQTIPQLEQSIEDINAEINAVTKQTKIIVEQRNQKEGLVKLVKSMPPLHRLSAFLKHATLYRSVSALLEGCEWAVDWNRRDPFKAEVENFLPDWNSLVSTLEMQKDAYAAMPDKYKQIEWKQYDEAYHSFQALMPDLLEYVDIDAFQERIVALIKPLLNKSVSKEEKQKQIALVEAEFNKLMATLDQQSSSIKTLDGKIDELKKANASQVADIKYDEVVQASAIPEKVISKMKSLYSQYEWRMDFTTNTIHTTIANYSNEHSLALFEVLINMLTPEAYHGLCLEVLGIKPAREDVKWSKVQRNTIFQQAIKFIGQQAALFTAEEDKIAETNRQVTLLLEKMDQNKALANADVLYASTLTRQEWVIKYSIDAVERELAELNEKVTSNVEMLRYRLLTKPKWPEKLKTAFYESAPTVTPRLTELIKRMTSLQQVFMRLSQCPQATTSSSEQYNKIVEKYNELRVAGFRILNTINRLLATDALYLKESMSEFETTLEANITEATKLISNSMTRGVEYMEEGLKEASPWLGSLNAMRSDFQAFSGVIPSLQLSRKHIINLSKHRNLKHTAVKEQHQDYNAPLNVIPVSLFEIRTYWIDGIFNYFEKSHSVFVSEELERERYTNEAHSWAAMMRPNYEVLKDASALWESVCAAEIRAKESHRVGMNNQAALFAKLDKLKLQLDAKALSNFIIRNFISEGAFVAGLKLAIMAELNELNPANPFSLAKVKFSLNELLRKEADIWDDIKADKNKLDIALQLKPDYRQKSTERLNTLFATLAAFMNVAKEGEAADLFTSGYMAQYGVTDALSNNLFTKAKYAIEQYYDFKRNCRKYQLDKVQAMMTESVGNVFALPEEVERRLAPVKIIQDNIEKKEGKLHEDAKLVSRQLKQFARDMQALRDEFDNVVASVNHVEMRPVMRDSVLEVKPVLSTETLALMALPKEQSIIKKEVVAESSAAPSLITQQQIIDAINGLVDASDNVKTIDPVVLTAQYKKLLAEKHAALSATQRKIEYAHRTQGRLAHEKAALERAQRADQQKLFELARLLLAKEVYENIEENVKNPMQALELLNKRFDMVRLDTARFNDRLSKLNATKIELKHLEGNGYTQPLTELNAMTHEALGLLHDKTEDLRDYWVKILLRYQALTTKIIEFNPTNALEIMFKELMSAFGALNNLDDLSEVVTFSDVDSVGYKSVKSLSADIVKLMTFTGTDKQAFLQGYVEDFMAPLVTKAEHGNWTMRSSYLREISKVTETYQWLLDVNARIRLFKKLIDMPQTIDPAKITALTDWVDHCVAPFAAAYKIVCEREKQITQLDALINKLTIEENALAASAVSTASPAPKKADLRFVEALEPRVKKRVEQINEFKLQESLFNKARDSFKDERMLVNVTGAVFLRFKCLFLSNANTLEILAELAERAKKHDKDTNRRVIPAFIQQIRDYNLNLLGLVNLIQEPVENNKLTVNGETITLLRTRGGSTESGLCIQKLNNVLQVLIKDHAKILFVQDLQAEFAVQKAQLKNDDYLDADKQDTVELHKGIFSFYCASLESELKIETKHSDIVTILNAELLAVKNSGDDELTRLTNLKAHIETAYQDVSQRRGGKPGLFGPGSDLGKMLKLFVEHLDQTLASYSKAPSFRGTTELHRDVYVSY